MNQVYADWFSNMPGLVVPPRDNAAAWKEWHPRNDVLTQIQEKGLATWKKESGYHHRSLAENAMYRLKQLFGDHLASRLFESQVVEVHARIAAMNVMTYLGMPVSIRVNRVAANKKNGLVIDYNGMLKSLRKALATFAQGDAGGPTVDPLRDETQALADYAEAILKARMHLMGVGYDLDKLIEAEGFDKQKIIETVKTELEFGKFLIARQEVRFFIRFERQILLGW